MRKRIVTITVFLLCITAGSTAYWFFNNNSSGLITGVVDNEVVNEECIEEPALLKYGINIDSIEIEEFRIQKNQTLATILGAFNVGPLQVSEICKASLPVYNLANIHSGKKYTVFTSRDSLKTLQCFVYEASPMDHIVVKLTEGIEVFKDDIPVDTTVRKIGGLIRGSLYETLKQQDTPSDLAVRMSQLFAWQIDFFRLFEGDNFRIIYEEISVNGTPMKTGKILAASFEQQGKPYYAISFEEDGKAKFFNEEGKNVIGAFLKAPLKFFRITSHFSKNRFHPVLKKNKAHLGTDYAAPAGTPILAVGSGKVVEARYSQFNGNYVKIKHNNTYSTQYLHMSKFAGGIRKGASVAQGQVIGYVGSTGLATGPHVCYRFWKNGKQVDPRSVNVVQTDPIKSVNREAFNKVKDYYIAELGAIEPDEGKKTMEEFVLQP